MTKICEVCGKELGPGNPEYHIRSEFHQAALKARHEGNGVKFKAPKVKIPKLKDLLGGNGNKENSQKKSNDKTDDPKRFFENLQSWKPEKPKSLIKRVLGRPEPNMKTCVFVGDGEPPEVTHIQVDPHSQLIVNPTTKEVYLKPLRGDIYFFNRNTCLPLVDCPPVEEDYDLPEHLALKFYNLGFGEAELSGYKDLLDKINKWQLQVTIAFVVCAICAIATAYVSKTFFDQVDIIMVKADELIRIYG